MLAVAAVAPIIAPMPADLRAAPAPLSRKFDAIFRRYGRGLPVPFLRALAKRESNLKAEESKGSYWGLLQVGWRPTEKARARGEDDSVLGGYNKRHGTSYTREDLFNPVVNIKVATDTLQRIIRSYKRNHPGVVNLQENWANPEFVKLLVAGWNSGYSEAAGVGRVAHYLERHGIPVTHDNVFEYAASAGGTKHLSNLRKRDWQRTVADLYYAQPDARHMLSAALNPLQLLLPHAGLQGTLPVSPRGLSLVAEGTGGQVWKWSLAAGVLASIAVIGYAIMRRT